MFTVGITGSFGSGKSTVAGFLRRRGADVLDADKISRQLIGKNGKCRSKVIKKFGGRIVTNGQIDREKLADEAFSDERKLRALEKILHPAVGEEIKKEFKRIARRDPKAVAVIDVPLLFEAGFDRLVEAVLVVKAKRLVQLKRLKAKGVSPAEFKRRRKRQLPILKKIRLADFVIDNSGSLNSTQKQARKIWERIQRIDMGRSKVKSQKYKAKVKSLESRQRHHAFNF